MHDLILLPLWLWLAWCLLQVALLLVVREIFE